jgi:hypothetical protein
VPAPLPSVLAGPIVRRVDSTQASIWIALRDPADVTAFVWQGIQVGTDNAGAVGSGDAPLGSAQLATRRIAQHLHVAVVSVKPVGGMAPGAIFSYDVAFGGKTLRSLGMLADEPAPDPATGRAPGVALGYATDRLPTFRTPVARLEDVRIAHGSCRRSNGPGFDALAWLDDLLEETLTNIDERPQQLFLTGDQIYADDLGPEMLWMLSDLAGDVMGNDEKLHVDANEFVVNRANFPPSRRQKFVRETGAFSTGDGESHLMSFGEFVAMYLAVWNPRVWRPLGKSQDIYVPFAGDAALADLLSKPESAPEFGNDVQKWRAAAEKPGSGFATSVARTQLFRSTVPKVARALANIATYMICDDHEVTDDWNLNKKWQNRAYTRATGSDIVRNALLAYGVFQGWGNDPARFEAGKNKEFLDEVTRMFGGNGPYPVGPFDKSKDLTGVSGADKSKRPVWNYQVTGNLYTVIVLDTRTHRSFEGQGTAPPDLLGENRDEQIPAGPFTDGRQLLFLVSAAPVFGPEAIESLGWPLATLIHDAAHLGEGLASGAPGSAEIGAEKRDLEGWASNPTAREALLKRVATYPSAVFLSGDVHYACSMVLDYYRKGVAAPSRIVQLTASPLRNEFKELVNFVVRTDELVQTMAAGFAAALLGWNTPPTLNFAPGAIVSPGRKAKLKRTPAFALNRGWPPGTSIPASNPPDWSWRARLQRDARPDTAIPSARRPLNLPAADELSAADPLRSYRAEAARHQQSAITHFDLRRQIVFAPNIGIVRISKSGTGFSLTHTLLSEDAPDSITSAPNTVHEIALTPGAKPDPAPGAESAPVLETR